MIRVFIADDHPLVRKGLKDLLSEEPDMKIVGEASNAHEVMEGCRSQDIDVLVLDFTMPGRNGLDLVRELRVRRPRLPILILSMHPEERFAVRALKAGAAGYLTKETPPEEIMTAIKKVHAGGKYLSHALAEKLAFSLDREADKLPHEFLSDRELQVMCMLASGKKVKQIADELKLSFRTIHTFRSRILSKMNMKSDVELTHYALRNRLID